MSIKQATVREILESNENLQILKVSIDETLSACLDEVVLAYNYLQLGKSVSCGQRVFINTTGIGLALGTGGLAFIVPNQYHDDAVNYGHMVKLRYSPLQIPVDCAEEQQSPHHELLRDARSIEGMPVVCCGLHSQMPLVAAALKQKAPETKVAYIMDDSAALPLAFSKLVPQVLKAGLIDATVSCGQAFGGQYEAINLYSALLVTHLVCEADVAIVAPGPGLAGTGTAFGFSGTAQGEALNAVAALEGRPIAALRLSWQDPRPRHQGLSHHSETILAQICHTPVSAAIPGSLSLAQREELEEKLAPLSHKKGHDFPTVEADFFDIDLRGVEVTTMRRSYSEDPEFFSAALAAGILAAQELRIDRFG